MNIRLNLQSKDKETKLHPMLYIKSLGIEWESATSCSLADAWWFCGCTHLPDPLPHSIDVVSTPTDMIHTFGDTYTKQGK